MSDLKPVMGTVDADQMKSLYSKQTARRRVPRRAIHQSVGLLISGEYFLGKAFEIGEGGLLIESPVPLNVKDLLVVTVRIPGVFKGSLLAKVIYVLAPKNPGEQTRFGVSFEKIEFEMKRQIRNYVAANTGDAIFENLP